LFEACAEVGPVGSGQSATTAGGADASADGASDEPDADADSNADADADADASADADAAVATADATTDAPASALLTALTISTGALNPTFSPGIFDYTISSLNSLYLIDVVASADGARIRVNGQSATSGAAASIRLAPRQDIVIDTTASDGSATRTYTVHYIPDGFPAYTVASTAGHGDEVVLLTPNQSMLLMVDRSGAPLYYRVESGTSFIDFQRFDVDGVGPVYTFLRSDPQYPQGFASIEGVGAIMSQDFRDTGRAMVIANAGHGDYADDAHDLVLLGDQHYIAMSYVQESVDLSAMQNGWSAQALVVANVVQEVDHGNVVLEWRNTEHASLFTDSVDGNAFGTAALQDYTHLNSIDVDPTDGNLILSLRHTNSILKIDRHTGDTLWTLGGASDDFSLSNDQLFSHQHHVRVQKDGSLLLFDNGNGAHQTRVMSFVLDEGSRTVLASRVVYERPAEYPPTAFMGSAFWLGPQRYLIGWGGWGTSATAPSVSEIVNGQEVWSLTFEVPSIYSYRAIPIAYP
jgi:hypothetical protein